MRLILLSALALVCISSSFYLVTAQISWYDVTRYGAVGDGKTDCSAAVQRAVNALLTSGADGSGTIYFPAATYLLSQPPPSFTQPAYITIGAQAAGTNIFIIAGEMPSSGPEYAQPLTTIIWNSAEAQLINYQGLVGPSAGGNQRYLTIANLTITTPTNIVGWRSMVEWNAPNEVYVTNVNYVGNGISPQMLLFNSLSAGNINFQSVAATNVNLFFQTFVTGSTNSLVMSNVTVTNENYDVSQQALPTGIILQGAITSITIGYSTFNSTNLFFESASNQSPTVSIGFCAWYDSNAPIVVADSSNVNIISSSFNVVNAGGHTITGTAITAGIDIPSAYPIVTISDSIFNGSTSSSYSGILQNLGQTTLSNNMFHSLSTGFNYTQGIETNQAADHPFSLMNNYFSDVTVPAIGGGSLIVVSGNECQGSGSMQILCDADCSIEENSPSCDA